MGQKINPFGYRLGITENHRSKWFSDSNKAGERYRDFVLEDDQIRKEMSKDLERARVSRIVVAPRLSAFAPSSRSSPASRSSSTSSKSRTPRWTPSSSLRASLSS